MAKITSAKKKTAKKTATKKTAAKKTAAKRKITSSKPVPPKKASAVDKTKPFEDNLQTSIEEETPGKKAKSGKSARGKKFATKDVPVQNLLGSFQDRFEKMLAEIPLPKYAFLDKNAAPKDIEIEELGSGVMNIIGQSPVGETVSDLTGLVTSAVSKVTSTTSKVTETISSVARKLK